MAPAIPEKRIAFQRMAATMSMRWLALTGDESIPSHSHLDTQSFFVVKRLVGCLEWILERVMSMLETKGLFVLEYSLQQKAWRINSLEVTLKYNIGSFAKGKAGNDYRILAISESRDQLREFKKSLVKQREEMG